MNLSDFDYVLPKKLIATHPVDPRDEAKMMVIDTKNEQKVDSVFKNLPKFLCKGDLIIFNNSKVFPARLFGKEDGGLEVEILLLKQSGDKWEALIKPGKKMEVGKEIIFKSDLKAEVLGKKEGHFILIFNKSGSEFWSTIESVGEMPLPPYILKERGKRHDEDIDRSDYQTVFADRPGSVAAPTAGLHFTENLLKRIIEMGCQIGYVDLHVGLGTFEPVRTERIEDHQIHSEYYEISAETAEKVNKAKKEGRRVIAVGTTSVRVLESAFTNGEVISTSGETSIYIYPGYQFKVIDGLITNFHLPKSTLLMLISAFWQREKVLKAYQEGISKNYRFYSYGDGMFLY